MRETRELEFKQDISSSFLKTVSAFANYGTGRIVFGVDDSGRKIGLDDPVAACLSIENKVNDALDPVPQFRLHLNEGTSTIELTVYEGAYKPYLYRGKAYRRADSATVAVDRLELGRLYLEGSHRSFDGLEASRQDLAFSALSEECISKLGIDAFSLDVMRTLELCDRNGVYNNAAQLLADENPFRGIDIVRFGDSEDVILERIDCSGRSVLVQYTEALAAYRRYYCYERIEGSLRKAHQLVPEEAFREVVANALAHRAWDVNASISIAMYQDNIAVVSPGGLPPGVTKEDYLSGHVSSLRNPILGNVMFRLNYIERFGTGVYRVLRSYSGALAQPTFDIGASSIRVNLPVVEAQVLTPDEEILITAIGKGGVSSRSDLSDATGFSRDKTIRLLKSLINRGLVVTQGAGRAVCYRLFEA